ncbi:hypothetical protein LWC35_11970 [Pseudonocardia kujensis]|uniref:hypothetical protein n=1 Tax=Pseudonocardia kujensis TaxID=1128675 RepID=UPI001E47B7BE|nr:hypothetical protein [Pseudonocardia kujensis]MCE0763615.1 hypothetical protein [Pseudonocardia kujensis]
MARPLDGPGHSYLRPVADGGDPASVLTAVLCADVREAAELGLITLAESEELLARLATVVDQAVGGR